MASAASNTIWIRWTASSAATTIATSGIYNSAGSSDLVATNPASGCGTIHLATWAIWAGVQEETAEQRAARQREQRLRDLWAAEKAAQERAEQLLLACLSSEQRAQLQKQNWFEVRAPSGRRYRIRRGRSANVVEVDTSGKQLRRYCCHPYDGVPDPDTMLAQKLMLEAQEAEFLRLANVS